MLFTVFGQEEFLSPPPFARLIPPAFSMTSNPTTPTPKTASYAGYNTERSRNLDSATTVARVINLIILKRMRQM